MRAVFDDQIELADEGGEGAGLRDLAELSLQRLTDTLVRVRAQDVIHAVRARLVGQIQLLREAQVRRARRPAGSAFPCAGLLTYLARSTSGRVNVMPRE